jgi:hypothetical protein
LCILTVKLLPISTRSTTFYASAFSISRLTLKKILEYIFLHLHTHTHYKNVVKTGSEYCDLKSAIISLFKYTLNACSKLCMKSTMLYFLFLESFMNEFRPWHREVFLTLAKNYQENTRSVHMWADLTNQGKPIRSNSKISDWFTSSGIIG